MVIHYNVTPQERFNAIVKECLHPLLKKYNFKKKGTQFLYEGEQLSYIVKTYKSRWNTKEELSFRIEWEVIINKKKTGPGIVFDPFGLYGDLNSVTRSVNFSYFDLNQSDVNPKAHDEVIKEQISSHLESDLIPFLFSLQSVEDVIRILETTPIKEKLWGTPEDEGHTLNWLARLYYNIENTQKSIALLDKVIKITKFLPHKKYFEETHQKLLEEMNKKII